MQLRKTAKEPVCTCSHITVVQVVADKKLFKQYKNTFDLLRDLTQKNPSAEKPISFCMKSQETRFYLIESSLIFVSAACALIGILARV